MANGAKSYTYRGGEKLELLKRDGEFVARALPNDLVAAGLPDGEQMSSASTRIACRADELERLMARARGLGPTHHAYEVAETGDEFLITDRVFVSFKAALSAEDVAKFAGEYGLIQLEAYSDRDHLFQLTDSTGMNPVKLVVRLTETDDRVATAENDLNHRMTMAQQVPAVPLDPHYLDQWHLHTREDHPAFDVRASSRCEEAWQALGNFGDDQVVIGVTDDGCRLDHQDFNSPGKFAGWGYFEGRRLVTHADTDAVSDRMYQLGANHGTSCAGVAAGEVDGVLTVGAAPGCRLLPVKWESRGPFLLINDSKLLTALNFMGDRVDIVSNSWGHVPVQTYPISVINKIRQLATTGGRRGRGIVFLWAAGNENCPIQHDADIDTPFTDGVEVRNGSLFWVGVQTTRRFRNNLATMDSVMHIAALASNARRSHYSNYGTGIDLCAPTNNVHTYHRMQVVGLGVTTTTGGTTGAVTPGFGGTSSATPLVAGVAALVISANPTLPAAEVISILKRTAAKDLDMTEYARTPPASFDNDTSWDVSPIAPFDSGLFQDIGVEDGTWSPWFGHGRVDAAAAATEALPEPTEAPTRFFAEPELDIPDDDPSGVKSKLEVPQSGRIEWVKVDVTIDHSWVGDLRVVLISPAGTPVVLHDRKGGSRHNIHQTFDLGTTPALGGLHGEDAGGRWTLEIQDRAERDVGILRSWGLDLALSPAGIILEDNQATTIPDNDPNGISRSLTVDGNPTIAEVTVGVDITHTWIGDLQVILTPPTGAPVALHDRSGRSADNIVRTWRSADHPGLGALVGQDAGGTWTLTAADKARRDIGKLNRWRLEILS